MCRCAFKHPFVRSFLYLLTSLMILILLLSLQHSPLVYFAKFCHAFLSNFLPSECKIHLDQFRTAMLEVRFDKPLYDVSTVVLVVIFMRIHLGEYNYYDIIVQIISILLKISYSCAVILKYKLLHLYSVHQKNAHS